jgi:hypothetical protein
MGQPGRVYLPAHGEYIAVWQPTQGTETSKYLEEKKANAIPSVVASERGTAQTGRRNSVGVVGPAIWEHEG